MDLYELNLVIEVRQEQTREDQIYCAWLGALAQRSKDFPSFKSLLSQEPKPVEPKPEPKTSAEARAEFSVLVP